MAGMALDARVRARVAVWVCFGCLVAAVSPAWAEEAGEQDRGGAETIEGLFEAWQAAAEAEDHERMANLLAPAPRKAMAGLFGETISVLVATQAASIDDPDGSILQRLGDLKAKHGLPTMDFRRDSTADGATMAFKGKVIEAVGNGTAVYADYMSLSVELGMVEPDPVPVRQKNVVVEGDRATATVLSVDSQGNEATSDERYVRLNGRWYTNVSHRVEAEMKEMFGDLLEWE